MIDSDNVNINASIIHMVTSAVCKGGVCELFHMVCLLRMNCNRDLLLAQVIQTEAKLVSM